MTVFCRRIGRFGGGKRGSESIRGKEDWNQREGDWPHRGSWWDEDVLGTRITERTGAKKREGPTGAL